VTFVSPSASAEARFSPPVPSPAPTRDSSNRGSNGNVSDKYDYGDGDSDDEEEEEEVTPPPPPTWAPPKPQSRLSSPHPNSSKALRQQMLQLKSKIDKVMSLGTNVDDDQDRGEHVGGDIDDLLSISTLETTESDRLAGRMAAINALNVPQHMPRYEVTPILDIKHPALLYQDGRRPAQIKKSVDPAWLMRRQTQGPAASDLQALYAPDPVVRVAIHSTTSTPTHSLNTAAAIACVDGKRGLLCSPDEETYHPVFSNNLVFTQLFGSRNGASGEGNAAIDRAGDIDMRTGVGAQWSEDSGFLELAYMSELLTI